MIKKILTFDVEARLTPLEALLHPFFHNIADFEESKKLPHLL